ncbi:GtrA family protein [Paucibacter sp. APW11]|uniref:GtrA family protein n=1 Tax=Roseateles aquae TaxID=3077235 RepID=A0ABU3P7W8_9BURK|nr:GtrA family protein [Paucibacter sp. APW11]MDT8997841.1 GtrA family protein [Paucibacter sp. APW11]
MRSLLWFGAVGASAAAVHFAVVWWLVERFGWPALAANVAGFALAFCVSFTGHHRFSFAAQEAKASQALPRFALVAGLGFVSNELMYALLLRLGLEYRLALLLVLVAVAAMTWLLSRHWAFKGREA